MEHTTGYSDRAMDQVPIHCYAVINLTTILSLGMQKSKKEADTDSTRASKAVRAQVKRRGKHGGISVRRRV